MTTMCVCVGAVSATAQNQASFAGLGLSANGGSTIAFGVSADGLVVVGLTDNHPFRWTQATGIVDLGLIPGAGSGRASAASADGSVVVGSTGFDTGAQAFRWSASTGMVGLGLLPGSPNSYTVAEAVSQDGNVIVGCGAIEFVGFRAFIWTAGSGMALLPNINPGLNPQNWARAVSADGSIVVGTSTSNTPGTTQAVRWINGAQFGLGDLPGGAFLSDSYGTSPDGSVVVGMSVVSSGLEAFRWKGTMQSLGDLPGGATVAYAQAVSADGNVVVGKGSTAAFFEEAFIWDPVLGMRNLKDVLTTDFALNLTGWTLTAATGISADGLAIVGYGTNPSGLTEAWLARLPSPDSDGDGLLDSWETSGIPYIDSTGVLQHYMLPGANKNHKDLYIEIDAMSAAGLAPNAADLAPVVQAFATAPVANPDLSAGVTLHLQLDETNISTFNFPNDFAEFDALKLTSTASGTTLPGYFGTATERNDPAAAAIREAKRQAFRYCIFGNMHGSDTSSGLSELPGNDFMVTLGGWGTPGGTSNQKAGTFMHEMGHSLGLGHGGRDAVTGPDHILYKPNYYSIMNYTWQTPEPWMTTNSWPLSPGKSGYSKAPLLDLDESALTECQGVAAPGALFNNILVPHNTHNSTSAPVAVVNSFMCCAIDWNNDNTVVCFPDTVAVDLNHLIDGNTPSPGEVLHGREDWSKLLYNFRDSPDFADGVHATTIGLPEEMSYELLQQIANLAPAFCLGDINLDRIVNVDDLLAVINGWGPCSPTGLCPADIEPSGETDGVVNVDDLLAVINTWGKCP